MQSLTTTFYHVNVSPNKYVSLRCTVCSRDHVPGSPASTVIFPENQKCSKTISPQWVQWQHLVSEDKHSRTSCDALCDKKPSRWRSVVLEVYPDPPVSCHTTHTPSPGPVSVFCSCSVAQRRGSLTCFLPQSNRMVAGKKKKSVVSVGLPGGELFCPASSKSKDNGTLRTMSTQEHHLFKTIFFIVNTATILTRTVSGSYQSPSHLMHVDLSQSHPEFLNYFNYRHKMMRRNYTVRT